MTQSEPAIHSAGSGRSFTAYVFVKSDKVHRTQRASLADASAAQPLSPQALAAQKVIAESPTPITTPLIAAASRLPPCQMPACSKAESADTISVNATAGVVEPTECTDTCTDQAEACGMTDRSCDAHEPSTDQRGAKARGHHSYGKHFDDAHCFPLFMCTVLYCSNMIDIYARMLLTILGCFLPFGMTLMQAVQQCPATDKVHETVKVSLLVATTFLLSAGCFIFCCLQICIDSYADS